MCATTGLLIDLVRLLSAIFLILNLVYACLKHVIVILGWNAFTDTSNFNLEIKYVSNNHFHRRIAVASHEVRGNLI